MAAEEERLYHEELWKASGAAGGVLTGQQSVAFFSKTGLSTTILGEIWNYSDAANTGVLTRETFAHAMRLIGHAQQGTPLREQMKLQPGPFPRLDLGSVPLINDDERTRYLRMFNNTGPIGGRLDKQNAYNVLLASKLPSNTLNQVLSLADQSKRNSLDPSEFVVAMHLVRCLMSGSLKTVPASLSSDVLASAHSVAQPQPPPAVSSPATNLSRAPSLSVPPPTSTPPSSSFTAANNTTNTSASPPPFPLSSAQSPFPSADPWDITAQEKSQYDSYFATLDPSSSGFVTGSAAVPFFTKSNLPTETLAQVWDLASVRKQDTLDKDEFAVAMKLLNDRLAGKPIPSELPRSLVPPKLRGFMATPQSPSIAPPQHPPPQQQQQPQAPPPPQRDLFSLFDDDEPTAASSATTTTTTTAAPVSSPPPTTSTTTPSAAYMTPTNTGRISSLSTSPQVQQQQASRSSSAPINDLFADDNNESTKIDDKSAELGNLRNQANSTSQSLSSIQVERSNLEQATANSEKEINDLRSRLAQSKASFEAESKLVNELVTKHKEQSVTIASLKEELIRQESDLSALLQEKQDTEQNFLRDKEEVRNLKAKMTSTSEQVTQVKEQLEKLKKEARQQKGFVAISKKQLATVTSEHDRAVQSLESFEKEQQSSSDSSDNTSTTTPAAGGGAATSTNESDVANGHVKESEQSEPFTSSTAATATAVGAAAVVGTAAHVNSEEPTESPFGNDQQQTPDITRNDSTLSSSSDLNGKADNKSVEQEQKPESSATPAITTSSHEELHKTKDTQAQAQSQPQDDASTIAKSPPSVTVSDENNKDKSTDEFDNSKFPDINDEENKPQDSTLPSTKDVFGQEPDGSDSSDDESEAGPEPFTAKKYTPDTDGKEQKPPGQEAPLSTTDATTTAPANVFDDNFDSQFPDLNSPKQLTKDQPLSKQDDHNKKSTDLFDDDFDDLPEAKPVPGGGQTLTNNDSDSDDDDDDQEAKTSQKPFSFDTTFDTNDPFGTNSASAATPKQQPSQEPDRPNTQQSLSAFDDAFSSLDAPASPAKSIPVSSSAEPFPSTIANTTTTTNNNNNSEFPGFDDSFGSAPVAATPTFEPPPTLPPRTNSTSNDKPAEDDSVEVKQVCGLGFSRSQALDALEKHGYDVTKAIDSLTK